MPCGGTAAELRVAPACVGYFPRKQPRTRQPRPTAKAHHSMINFFRSFFQSKLGLGLTIGFLVLIALALA